MDKRTLLAVGLSILVLMVFQFYFAPKQPQNLIADNSSVKTDIDNVTQTKQVADKNKQEDVKKVQKPVLEIKEVILSNTNLKLVFDENTGDINKAEIIQFKGKDFGHVSFENPYENYYSVYLNDNLKFKLDKQTDTSLSFVAESNGLIVTKTYNLPKEGFELTLNIDISNIGNSTLSVPLKVKIGPELGKNFTQDRYIFTGPLIFDGKKVIKKRAKKIKEAVVVDSPQWIAYTSKYFLFASIGEAYQKGIMEKQGDSAIVIGKQHIKLNPGVKESITYKLFIGPKQFTLLKSIGYSLYKSIDFGIFAFLAIPLLQTLIFLHGFVKNYGVAIILLTVIIKIITYPLTKKSMVSMKKMQKFQPQIQKIKEKYKGDAQKINAATMELYKKEGINPMGGCLPMFLQIPIFFALYKSLMVAIELKNEPFFGWITDMSMKDPYYITPILMGITMFLQQKLSPSAGTDDFQKKLFLAMPLVFTFLFLNFPAGLVIYWLTNNILSIVQQIMINKKES
jgi:YidC/Oxa1 family membrane protein insertase